MVSRDDLVAITGKGLDGRGQKFGAIALGVARSDRAGNSRVILAETEASPVIPRLSGGSSVQHSARERNRHANLKPEHREGFNACNVGTVGTVRTPRATTEPSHIHIPRPAAASIPPPCAEGERLTAEVALDEAA